MLKDVPPAEMEAMLLADAKVEDDALVLLANARAQAVKDALAETGVAGEIVKVTEMQEIIAHDVVRTPGLWIEGKLVSSGRLPATATVAGWIREAAG